MMRASVGKVFFGVALGLSAFGCSHPQRPYVFLGEGLAAADLRGVLVNALAAQGLTAAGPGAEGAIVTTWTDTGYRVREPAPGHVGSVDLERRVFRRYQVAVAPDESGRHLTVRLQTETRSCTPDVRIGSDRLAGNCRDLGRFWPGLQGDMDELGRTLQRLVALHEPSR